MSSLARPGPRARIASLLAALPQHMDHDLSLPELAALAGFSPFHFHRIFRAITGETVASLIRRLRLERAARALRHTGASVMDVALDAGYGSPEAFARAFQQAFGATPSDYRSRLQPPPYAPRLAGGVRLDNQTLTLSLEPPTGGTCMDVRIETLPDRFCVCLRHVGPLSNLPAAFHQIISWVAKTGRFTPATTVIGLAYDDVRSVPAAELRYDVCVTIPESDDPLPDGFRYERVGGGRWAIHTLRGPYGGMLDAFQRLFCRWLPESGEELDDRPCMEIYLNDAGEVPESELLTDLCIPLRPA